MREWAEIERDVRVFDADEVRYKTVRRIVRNIKDEGGIVTGWIRYAKQEILVELRNGIWANLT